MKTKPSLSNPFNNNRYSPFIDSPIDFFLAPSRLTSHSQGHLWITNQTNQYFLSKKQRNSCNAILKKKHSLAKLTNDNKTKTIFMIFDTIEMSSIGNEIDFSSSLFHLRYAHSDVSLFLISVISTTLSRINGEKGKAQQNAWQEYIHSIWWMNIRIYL